MREEVAKLEQQAAEAEAEVQPLVNGDHEELPKKVDAELQEAGPPKVSRQIEFRLESHPLLIE